LSLYIIILYLIYIKNLFIYFIFIFIYLKIYLTSNIKRIKLLIIKQTQTNKGGKMTNYKEADKDNYLISGHVNHWAVYRWIEAGEVANLCNRLLIFSGLNEN